MSTIVEISGKVVFDEALMWLIENMPNPPLTEPQRWTIDNFGVGLQCVGVSFQNEEDATWFLLRWA